MLLTDGQFQSISCYDFRMLLFPFIKKAQVNILSIVVITKHFCFLSYKARDASETSVISGYFQVLAMGQGRGRWSPELKGGDSLAFHSTSVLGPLSSAAASGPGLLVATHCRSRLIKDQCVKG